MMEIAKKANAQYRHKSDNPLIVLAARLAGLASTQPARSSGSNETDFATSWSAPLHSGRMSDMLMVTSSMRMFNRLHKERSAEQTGKAWSIPHDHITNTIH